MQQRPQLEAAAVTIVSTSSATLDNLETYLRGAGVDVHCTRDLADCVKRAAQIVVVFPDTFRWEKVVATLAEIATQRPSSLPVLVTARPQRFERLVAPSVVILPRPAWGWTILEAIRDHLSGAEAASS